MISKVKLKRRNKKDNGIYNLKIAKDLLKEGIKSQTGDTQIYKILGAINNIMIYCEKSKRLSFIKDFQKQEEIFKKILEKRKKQYSYLSIFLNEKTKIERNDGLGNHIEEEIDLNKWKKERCNIINNLDKTTEINFCGLNLRVPTKIVHYQEEI